MGWTLGVAFGAVLVALVWRLRRRSTDGEGLAVTGPYRIQGQVELRNDCDGRGDALPERIVVSAVLTDGNRARLEASTEVELIRGDDQDEDGPDLTGSYQLEVAWSGRRPPSHWEPPRAVRVGGDDICHGLGCAPNTHCVNLASRPRRIPADKDEIEFTMRVTCICVPQ